MPTSRTMFLAVALLTAPLRAATSDLSGWWDFRYDPGAKGEAGGWQSSSSAEGWTRIHVPSSYDQALRNDLLYQGKAWYRTTFTAAVRPGERAFLRFDGVAIRAKVWVNATLAGEHRFPYTGFAFDVTSLLRNGPNLLVVLADNELLERAIPDRKCTGWWNYGGINRGVFLETRPELYTDSAVIATSPATSGWQADLKLATQNHGGPKQGSISARIEDAQGHTVWSRVQEVSFASGLTESRMSAALPHGTPWSPESPVLYTLRLSTRAAGAPHEKTVRFGLRQIQVRGTDILLNGKPVVLKGVNYHEMYPGAGMTLSREQVRRDMRDMKALGCNFVRLAHYSHDAQAYELADELGLMVWSEIPAWQTAADVLGDDEVWAAYGAPQLLEMIEQHRNHPSVVVWSVGNEFPSDKEPVQRYVTRGCDYVRRLDPTRLVTFASDRRDRDISLGAVDFIAVNEYYGWYYGTIHDLGPNLDLLHRKWPAKPIIISEFGTDSLLGWKNPSPPDAGMDYSEDYQVKLIGSHLGQMFDDSRRGYVKGAIVWVYADFPNPSAYLRRAAHPPVAGYMNCKGLVTDDRRHKRAWEVVREFFVR